jgi:hypothetical protein
LINSAGSESKYAISIPITSGNGVKGNIEGDSCFVETKLRLEVVGVGPTCTIDIEGRVKNSPNWYVITTSTGAITGTIDISTYDYIRYKVTNSDGTGVIYASGFVLNNPNTGSSGDASASNQLIGNAKLTSIDSKTSGSLLPNKVFDDIQVAYPTASIETYSYYYLGTLQGKIEVTYSDSTKRYLTRTRSI